MLSDQRYRMLRPLFALIAAFCVNTTAGACCTTQQLDDLANSYAMKQNVVATTRLAVPALVESAAARAGMRAAADGVAIFRPEAPLLHPVTHVRLSLSDARAMQQPAVAQCAYAVALHPPVAW